MAAAKLSTLDPTLGPTLVPTLDPTLDPTLNPTLDPTLDSTPDPTLDPTLGPTLVPVARLTPPASERQISRRAVISLTRPPLCYELSLRICNLVGLARNLQNPTAMTSRRSALWICLALAVPLTLSGAVEAAPFSPGQLRALVNLTLNDSLKPGPCRRCPDGLCAWFPLPKKAESLRQRLRQPRHVGRYALVLVRRMDGDRVLVASSMGPVRCQLTRVGRRTMLYLGTPTRRLLLPELRRFLLRKPPLIESKRLIGRVAGLEKMIAKAAKGGDHRPALRELSKLERHPAFAEYVKLRRADVALLAGFLPTAYTRYRMLSQGSAAYSGVGLYASFSAAMLAYIVDGRPTPKVLSQVLMAQTIQHAWRARRVLASALEYQGRLQEAFSLLRDDKLPASAHDRMRLAEAVVRRCVLAATPRCAALMVYRAEDQLVKDRRGLEVLLDGARAFLALGLPSEAARLAQQILRGKPPGWLQERAMTLLVRAYAEGNERFRALRAAAYYLSVYDRRAPGLADVKGLQAELLLQSGKVRRLHLRAGLPPKLAAEVKRALAVARGALGTIDGPLFQRLASLRQAQDRLKRALARLQQARGGKKAIGAARRRRP